MAITGKDRIELRLSLEPYKQVQDVRRGDGPRGVCFRSADELLASARRLADRYEYTSTSARKSPDRAVALQRATELKLFVAELTQDMQRLRGQERNKKRMLPACLYPSTGPYATEAGQETRFKRRSTAYHEKFHATIRDIEGQNGLDYMDECLRRNVEKELVKKYGDLFTKPRRLAKKNLLGWTDYPMYELEETLARVEEVRKSCRRSVEDCDSINRFMAGQFDSANRAAKGWEKKWRGKGDVDSCALYRLAQKIEADYGAPSGIYRKAAAACARPAPGASSGTAGSAPSFIRAMAKQKP